MYQLKILLLSFLTLATISQFSVAQRPPLGSQHQTNKPRGQGQTMSSNASQSPGHSDASPAATPLLFEIEAVEPIIISKDQVEKADAYQRYLKELRQWNRDALKVAEALQKEGEPRVVLDVTRFQSWRRKIRIRARHGSQHKQLIQHIREDDPNVSISSYDPPKNTLGRGAIQCTHPTKPLRVPKSVLDKMRPAPISVAPPLPTEAPLQLKFTNISDQTIQVGGDPYYDNCKIDISISGDRAFKLPKTQSVMSAEYRTSWTLLKPGETHTIKLKRLRFGNRGFEGYCLGSPGKHNVTVEYSSHDVSAGSDTVPISVTASNTVEVSLEKDQPKQPPLILIPDNF